MKRKIGLIIALVLVVTGVTALSGSKASATGVNGDIYCSLPYSAVTVSSANACAYILKTYHKSELTSCKDNLIKGKAATEACIADIKSHIAVTECPESSQDFCKTAYAEDIVKAYKKAKKTTSKAGMSLPAKCYVEKYENDTECIGGSNGSNGGNTGKLNTKVAGGDPENCSTLFPNSLCKADGSGIVEVLSFVIAVLTGTVVVAGTVGIIICGVLIMTARDNEQQLAMGKKRLMEVVIGMVAWILLAVLANLFIPKTSSKMEPETGVIKVESDEERKA